VKKTAQPSPRSLFSLPVVLLLVAAVSLILLFLYQNASKQLPVEPAAETLKGQFADRWQAQFQQMLSADKPEPVAVVELAGQLSAKGYWRESAQLLAEKLPPPFPAALEQRVAGLKLKNSLDAYYTANTADAQSVTDTRLDVRAQLQNLGDTRQMDAETLATLAKQSADFGLLPQAATLYAQLAGRPDALNNSQWWAEAARWAAQAGDAVTAASYARNALEQATSEDETRLYTYAWMEQALKAGQQEAVAAHIAQTSAQANSSADLQQLATISQRLGRPELSSQLYAQLAQQDASNQQAWYEKAAYWAEQAGQLPQAAQFLEQALALTTEPGQAHALRTRLLNLWAKAEQPGKALAVTKQLLTPDTGDWSLLEKGVFTALAAKDIQQASEWNQHYLKLHPEQADAFLRQADIEIMAEDFAQAAPYLKEAVRLEPDNILFRERWAFVAERNGDKALALDLWAWLYERTGKPEYRRSQVQVAHAEPQGKRLAFLRELAQTQALPGNTAQEVFYALAAQSPDEAETFMQDYLQRHSIPDRQAWQLLADWQVWQQRQPQALATWEQLEATLGADTQSRLMRMQLHWELKQKDLAVAVLETMDTPPAEATPYQQEIMREALLDAMQIALAARQPDVVQRLIVQAERQPHLFAQQGRYGLLKAQLAVQQQQSEQARALYQQLLSVEPSGTALRKQALFQYLALVQTDSDSAEFERLFQELDTAALEVGERKRLYELAISRALVHDDAPRLASLTASAQTHGIELAAGLQLGVAMKAQDSAAITRLLASGASLSLGDRVSAMVAVGRGDEAYAATQQALREATTPTEREQARALALSLAEGRVSSVAGSLKVRQFGGLDEQEQTATFRQGQGVDGLPFGYSLKASHTRLSGDVVADGVQHETDVTAGIHWQRSGRQLDAALGLDQRGDTLELHGNVQVRQQLSKNLDATILYGYHETPEESAWLRANAQRDLLQVGLEARLGEHNHAQVALWRNAFSEHGTGQELAEGQGGRVALVRRERMQEQTEWFTGIQGSVAHYEAAGELDGRQSQGVPADSRSLTLLAGIGNGAAASGNLPPQDDAPRYSLSTAIGKQWPGGTVSKHVEASVGKRVNQDDAVQMGVFYDQGSQADADHGVLLQYRKWLDFMDENND
jgi:hypothetical protein